MNNFIDKLKLIFVPFLVLALSIIGGYTFLNWQSQIQYGTVEKSTEANKVLKLSQKR